MTDDQAFDSAFAKISDQFQVIIKCENCRSVLRRIADVIIELTAHPTSEVVRLGVTKDTSAPDPPVVEAPPSQAATTAEDRRDEAATPSGESLLPLVEERCRLKATACRWLIERQGLSADEVKIGDCQLFARARDIPHGRCNLWMLRPTCPKLDDDAYQSLATCFDVLADAVGHLRRVDDSCSHGDYIQALKYAAEAQKLLNQQTQASCGLLDSDQLSVFRWLLEAASTERIFLPFLKADDIVNFNRCTELGQEISATAMTIDAKKAEYRSQQKLMKKLRFQLARSVEVPKIEFQASVFRTLVDLTDKHNLPPSNVELRTLLVDHLNSLPECDEHSPKSVQAIYGHLANYLETVPKDELSLPQPQWNEDVNKVASLIEGRSVILIGGVRKPNAESEVREAFRLESATWIESQDVTSYKDLKAAINQAEICLVLHLTRFSRHIFKIQELCERLGKPYVRVTGGYNPNNIARNVLEQVGQSLK